MKKHGHANPRTPTYRSWEAMKNRCNSKKSIQFHDYGGRGISYDHSWESFENFLTDMGERPPGCFLDRKNNEKGYSKENCQWSTQFEQNNNKRNVKKYVYIGEEKTLSQWAIYLGVKRQFLYQRVHRDGMTIEEAITRKNRLSNRAQDRATR